jgi:D-alanyl-D-alanine carboxypeptidase/D-alanyl-D-alanine-endopeptidase (penicillin-binding protein 4)
MTTQKIFLVAVAGFLLASCGIEKQIQRSAKRIVLENKALTTAHVGISIYEPAARRSWFDYQGDHYFVPASNTKIPTCYAAMKYLGDSLLSGFIKDSAGYLYVQPAGDPSFLHPEFAYQPLWSAMQNTSSKVMLDLFSQHTISAFGSGWSWDDYDADYLAERSAFPIYGNLIRFQKFNNKLVATPSLALRPPYMNEAMMQLLGTEGKFSITRALDENKFSLQRSNQNFTKVAIPFKTMNGVTAFQFLQDTLQRAGKGAEIRLVSQQNGGQPIYSIPTDSLLRPLMHRSDNFFAEQSLLMVSQQLFGYMNERKAIDSILRTDFADLPQRPRWADGSGLSRYNLFSPRDFVSILDKMQKEFGMERVKVIFPTGGEGTISSYYKQDSGFIYAKTGTLSGVVGFSGFLYTKKGKLLLFSTLINNHQASATEVRKAIEKFLQDVRDRY